MGTGINCVAEDLYREIKFSSPVLTDNHGVANAPEGYIFHCTTKQQLIKKYGPGKEIVDALNKAPIVRAKTDPAYNPGLPDRMVVIKG